ncbi:hypothetical protein J6590_043780 [Homalodisca vitripennis]|nr:hypothetical protein J6590_043780 [Homalodisca vitripennis]
MPYLALRFTHTNHSRTRGITNIGSDVTRPPYTTVPGEHLPREVGVRPALLHVCAPHPPQPSTLPSHSTLTRL